MFDSVCKRSLQWPACHDSGEKKRSFGGFRERVCYDFHSAAAQFRLAEFCSIRSRLAAKSDTAGGELWGEAEGTTTTVVTSSGSQPRRVMVKGLEPILYYTS